MRKGLQVFLSRHHRAVFYGCWLLLHILQATFTELFDDEAYYWVYSRFPAWGYFDHPPMIAVLIRAGYAIFQHEFGVRLLCLLLSTGTLLLMEQLTFNKNAPLFYAICFSLAIAQLGGILAVPDTPLMFFTALFFLTYKRFTGHSGLLNTLLLGLCIALLLYTKYHAVLIVLFTAMSNIRLWKQPRAWLALLVAALLFAPHLYWQYQHGLPSVRFHLLERNADAYRVGFTLSFLLGQLLITGPFAGWLLVASALKHRPASLTEKALQYSLGGIFLFFLVCTLKGRAEANWTIPAFVGLVVLAHQHLALHSGWRRWLYLAAPLTAAFVLLARILMVADLPLSWRLPKDEIHGNRAWVKEIHRRAGGLPVVFIDSYQRPSKYMFYSGQDAMSLNTPYYRRNNYNFWPLEQKFNGKPAYVVGSRLNPWLTDTLESPWLRGNAARIVYPYFSFSRVMIDEIRTGISDRLLTVHFRSLIPEPATTGGNQAERSSLSGSLPRNGTISLVVLKGKDIVASLPSYLQWEPARQPVQRHTAVFDLRTLPAGRYTAKLAIGSAVPQMPSLNSSGFTLRVK